MGLFGARPRPLRDSGLLRGFTDMHSHLLPGVDDGVRHMDETLAILGRYAQLGIRNVWCTPHIMEDVPNRTEDLRSRFEELRAAYDGPVGLHLAAEYMMDNVFHERLALGDLLPHSGNCLLVETSYFTPPANLSGTLDEIMSKGYFPILAHPERYLYMEMKDYPALKGRGIRLQLNLGSLSGLYGDTVRKRAEWIYSHGLYDMAGSDCHSRHMLSLILDGRIKELPSAQG